MASISARVICSWDGTAEAALYIGGLHQEQGVRLYITTASCNVTGISLRKYPHPAE